MARISFMTANYVARETGWNMTEGWQQGDGATNAAFAPLETYAARLDTVLAGARRAGFEAVDLWSAHLNAAWATDEHVSAARAALARHGLAVTSLHAGSRDREHFARTCAIAAAIGAPVIGGITTLLDGDRDFVAATLRDHGVRFGFENHPEGSPEEILARIGPDDADGLIGTAVDTGWYATQRCDPVAAIETLADRVVHVHLKDVKAAGAHETCRWGEGIVDVEGCVAALRRGGYRGDYMIEHEPEHHDPTDECAAMLPQLRSWLAGP
jgi:L-ribulose-5-phosphate 3-epimerase